MSPLYYVLCVETWTPPHMGTPLFLMASLSQGQAHGKDGALKTQAGTEATAKKGSKPGVGG